MVLIVENKDLLIPSDSDTFSAVLGDPYVVRTSEEFVKVDPVLINEQSGKVVYVMQREIAIVSLDKVIIK